MSGIHDRRLFLAQIWLPFPLSASSIVPRCNRRGQAWGDESRIICSD